MLSTATVILAAVKDRTLASPMTSPIASATPIAADLRTRQSPSGQIAAGLDALRRVHIQSVRPPVAATKFPAQKILLKLLVLCPSNPLFLGAPARWCPLALVLSPPLAHLRPGQLTLHMYTHVSARSVQPGVCATQCYTDVVLRRVRGTGYLHDAKEGFLGRFTNSAARLWTRKFLG